MTQEEKLLLLKDLSARLPYGVIVDIKYNKEHGSSDRLRICSEGNLTLNTDLIGLCIEEEIYLKPYLRPMSSMTEEEKKEYDSFLFDNLERESVIGYEDKAFGVDVIMRYRSWQVVQWLLKHHLDFNGLIDVYGLALEAPEGMYNIK